MRIQTYQRPELRDENDHIIQTGTYGKLSAFANSTNDGILDYINNNLEVLYKMTAGAIVSVDTLPTTGETGKFYVLKTDGKVYMYENGWVQVTTQAQGISTYDIAVNNGFTGTEQEWLDTEVYADDIVGAQMDADGYLIINTRLGQSFKVTLQPLVDAKTYADNAATSASRAKTSEGNAKASETAAKASQTASATSEKNALTYSQNAKTSETNSKTSETNAKASETNAEQYKISADSSATLAKRWAIDTVKVGTEDNGYSSYYWAMASNQSATNAKASEVNAKESETNAKESETNAKSSQTAAAISESNAKTYMDNALTYKNNASDSASEAAASKNASAISEQNAKTSATNAANSASAAKESETNAASSDELAGEKATAASTSASNAKTSETNAKTSETNSKTSESNAKSSEEKAKASETNAKASEDNAKSSEELAKNWAISETKVGDGDTEYSAYYWASQAKASETNSKTSETNAKASETAAKASETASKASEASARTSATNAANSASAAATSEAKALTHETNAANSDAHATNTANAMADKLDFLQNPLISIKVDTDKNLNAVKMDDTYTVITINDINGLTKAEIETKVSDGVSTANTYTDTKISNLVGSAPSTLDTLEEISRALGEDANLSATLMEKIGANTTLINNEVSARGAADTTLQTNINNEITARTNAVNSLSSNLKDEEDSRVLADTNLQSSIDNLSSTVSATYATKTEVSALQINPNWEETDTTSKAYILNKPVEATEDEIIALFS